MLLWLAMALMTGVAVLAVLWPLSRPAGAAIPDEGDLDFYRSQLAEIDREIERRALSPGDAVSSRAEAGRRLLRAQSAATRRPSSTAEPALRRRRAAAALALSVVPFIGLAVYGALGSPRLASGPAERPVATDLDGALARIEAHLAAHPDDLRGWDLIAPAYLSSGRYDDAAKAFSAARRAGGDTGLRLSGQGEALVAAGGGVVSADAADLFRRALALEPGSARPLFFLALASEQDGDAAGARAGYERIVAASPAGAPWLPIVEARLARLDGTAAAPDAPPVQATPEILAMVDGLDSRLRGQGGTEAEWARLVRSLVVLGRRRDARDRLDRAQGALADDARGRMALLGDELGLTGRAVP